MKDTGSEATGQKILLIDDSEEIHRLFTVHLKPLQIELLHAHSGRQGLSMAAEHLPAIILLDWQMPDMDGMAVLRELKADPVLRSIPVMLVTGNDEQKAITSAYALGAVDYIRKPVFGAEVRARVATCLQTQQLMAELTRQAYHDNLTGLPNRLLLARHITQTLERRRQSADYHFALLFFDFDRFKTINDSLGHDAGDDLLREIASRFRENLRADDTVRCAEDGGTIARIGGDEFVVLLNGLASPDDAMQVAQRLIDNFAASYRIGKHEVSSTASVGIVTSMTGQTTAEELLRDADTAMYEAKLAGRGRYIVFDEAMRTRVQKRLIIENDLRRAAEKEELFLVYQPIVSLSTGRVEGIEALVRWQHPRLGLLMPGQFIPVAEETGMIVSLEEWVLDRACAQLAAWRAALGSRAPESISVNISRQHLLIPDLARSIEELLQRSGIPPSALALEVIEGQMMENVQEILGPLKKLCGLGIEIHMDDFGTGHSSLACLRDFPISTVKIDRSFVASAGEGRDLMAVLSAIIELAHDLGMVTIAEGIESAHQVASLQALDCDYGQGYHFARPLTEAQMLAYLDHTRPGGNGFAPPPGIARPLPHAQGDRP